MPLTSELVSQFVKATKKETPVSKESTMYGTAVEFEGTIYVKLDGSDRLTPVTTTTDVKSDERVTVMIKNHTAVITGNISSPSASSKEVKEIGNKLAEFDIIVADKVSTDQLIAEQARIDNLIVEDIRIKDQLTATSGRIDTLETNNVTINQKLTAKSAEIDSLKTSKLDVSIANTTYATIENLNATNADIHNLDVDYGKFKDLTAEKFEAVDVIIDNLDATYATIELLDAERARISTIEAKYLTAESVVVTELTADVSHINTLMFGSATGTVIQSTFSNAVIAQLGNAQIKSAMIESLAADKITAGDIYTNNVRVMSEDGSLVISDETIQIKDDIRVRVQIGKDAAGDYSINIWDADGKLMFSEGGITDNAIKEAIIRNDMVSDNANISASKLDISSLFEEINGSTHTIKSNRIYMDAESQTLDVVFTEMSDDISGLSGDVTSLGSQITVVRDQITSKVWQQDIDTARDAMETKYTLLEEDLSGFHTTVAQTYTTKAEFNNLSIGGRNLVRNSSMKEKPALWVFSSDNIVNFANGYCEVYRVATSGSRTFNTQSTNNNKLLKPDTLSGGTFTLSAEIKILEGHPITNDSTLFYRCHTTELSSGFQEISIRLGGATTEWKKVSSTFTFGDYNFDSACQVGIALGDVANTGICVRNIKLEQGDKATDWTPAPEDIDSDIQTLNESIAKLDVKADGISASVSNLKIGGRNLMRYTQDLPINREKIWSYSDPSNCLSDTKDGVKLTILSNATCLQIPLAFDGAVKNEETVTLSFDYRGTLQEFGLFYFLQRTEPNVSMQPSNQTLIVSETEWQHYECTFSSNIANIRTCYSVLMFYNLVAHTGEWIEIKDKSLKLEKGNRATDWTPAPEDVQGDIDGLSKSIAEVDIKADEISIGVTKQISDLEIGGRNLFSGYGEEEIQLGDYNDVGSFTQFVDNLTFDPSETVGETYTISFWAKSPNGTTPLSIYNQNGEPRYFYFPRTIMTNSLGNEWEYFTHTFVNEDMGEDYTGTRYNRIEFYASAQMGVLVKKIKVEKGSKATDWTPAPEDVDEAILDSSDQIRQEIAESSSRVLVDAESITLEHLKKYVSDEQFDAELEAYVGAQLKLLEDRLTAKVSGVEDKYNLITKYFDFTINGLEIKSVHIDENGNEVASPYKIVIDNDNQTTYANGEKVQIIDAVTGEVLSPKLKVTEAFNLLGYKISKDETTGNVNWEYTGG